MLDNVPGNLIENLNKNNKKEKCPNFYAYINMNTYIYVKIMIQKFFIVQRI